MYSRASRHSSDPIISTFIFLCCITLLSPLILSSASAASEPVWACPANNNPGDELYIVPPSRVFATDYTDRQYCCPMNGFIDQKGNCGKFNCDVYDASTSFITECPDLPAEWAPFAELKNDRYYGAYQMYPSYPSYPSYGGTGYYSSEESGSYTRNRKCCPATSICVAFTNTSVTLARQENESIFGSMYACMTIYDADGNMIDQDYRPTVGRLNAEPAMTRQGRSPIEAVAAIDISSHCDKQPCGARGICTPTLDSYTCLCPPPFKMYPGGAELAFDKNCQYMFGGNMDGQQTYATVSSVVCMNSYICEPIYNDRNHWPITGLRAYPCPAGEFCGGVSSGASGNCTNAGMYCPPASSQSLVCPEGYYCPSGGKTKVPCPNGRYCPPGSTDSSECPEKSFCVQAASPFYDAQRKLTDRASPKIRCSRFNEAVTCPAGSTYPAALPAGSCDRGDCRAGRFCPQLCSQSQSCAQGYYCADGKHLTECPVGHECASMYAAQPLKCRAGTYQPYTGAVRWGWDVRDGMTECAWPCPKWHWNSDGASDCDSLSVWTFVFIFGMILLVPLVLGGIYLLVRHWWPAFRTLYTTASEDFNTDWNARTHVFQQELVQRIVREVMLMPISVQSSRMITASNSGNSPASPSNFTNGKQKEITPELNLSLLSEYRTFLSKLFLEFLHSPECPSIVWLLCQYKHLSVIDLQMHMSHGIKSEVMEKFHSFAAAYTHAQENLSPQSLQSISSQHQQNGSEEGSSGFNPLPANVLWDVTAEMRATLKSEFFLYADSWIQLKRATNTSIQDLCWLFGGVHLPKGESRLKPARLPVKLILQCVALSLAQVCRGSLSMGVQLIRQRVARFTGHAGALADSQDPSSSIRNGGASSRDVEMTAAASGAVSIVIPPSSSSEPPAMSNVHLPADQFKHALDSDAAEEDEEPKSTNIGAQLVDASNEPSDEMQ